MKMVKASFPFFRIVLLLALTAMVASCHQTIPAEQRDKDEENGFVVAQELSNSRVLCLAEDQTGQFWIGTFRGLNRYDGHEYHQYFCADDTLGLPDNQVQSLLCDKQGRLWVATVNGICRYNNKDNFDRIPMQTGNRNARKLLMDSKGRMFAYNGSEILVYDEVQHIFLPRIKRAMTNQSWGDCFVSAADDKSLLTIAHRNIQRMFKLVNQLMDFNKLENDTLRLSVEELDVVKVMNGVCDYFIYNARERGVALNRYGMEDELLAWTDGDKLEKILTNLISNALKFTPRGGHVDVSLDVVDRQVKVTVADSGKGIPKGHQALRPHRALRTDTVATEES